MLKRLSFWILMFALILHSCANRGNPTGGDRDIDPPVILKMTPDNFSINFTSKEIEIIFDEYVKLKNLQQQLIISPPMERQPEILPLGSASKKITIRLIDSLLPQTTYALSFGESITDNNEGNPYPFFKYVFSTGDFIDSLKVTGVAINSSRRAPESIISVMLYEIDSVYKDSIVYQKKPKYISQTTDSTSDFILDNIKSGSYKLIALEEENRNYIYEQGKDFIGFFEGEISLPSNELYSLNLFKEDVEYKGKKGKQISNNKLVFGYDGPGDKMVIELLSEVQDDYLSVITKDQQTDSLYYWYRSETAFDSLRFMTKNLNVIDTFTVKLRDIKRDSIRFSSTPQSTINLTDTLTISSNLPIVKVDKTLIDLVDQDTLSVAFNYTIDTLASAVRFYFEKKPSNNYIFKALPGAFVDFFEATNDTLTYRLKTKNVDDYGNLRVRLKNTSYPVIVQLTDRNGEVRREFLAQREEAIDFKYINPGIYYIRVISDSNRNGKYDTGRFLEGRQAESIKHYPEAIDIRSGWDQIIEFILQ